MSTIFTTPAVNSLRPADATGSAPSAGTGASASGFGDAISGAIKSLDQVQLGAEREMARAVAGQSPDLHKTIAAIQSADLSFQFALQVRNKAVGAYDEIMRMQV